MLVGAGAWRCVLIGLALLTLALHIAQIVWYQPAAQRGSAARPAAAHGALSAAEGGARARGASRSSVLLVTATQPAPCRVDKGDWVVSLATKNKWQYSQLHG